jgi:hypothetical protein
VKRAVGDAAAHCYIERIETNSSIIGCPSNLFEHVHRSFLDYLVASAKQRSGRTFLIGYAPVGAAECQHLNELLEDYPIGQGGCWQPTG